MYQYKLTWGTIICPLPACRPGPTFTTTPLSARFTPDSVGDKSIVPLMIFGQGDE